MNYNTNIVKPIAVLTVYDNEHVSYREVLENNELGAARGLYKKVAQSIFKSTYGASINYSFKSIINSKIKYADSNNDLKLIWTCKAHKRKLFFSKNNKEKEVDYAIPNLCFMILGNSLKVVAYISFGINKRIYKAPFTNITFENICMGSATLKLKEFKYYEDIIDYAEMQFFNSYFTHNETEYTKQGENKKKFFNNWLEPLLKKETPLKFKDFINEKI